MPPPSADALDSRPRSCGMMLSVRRGPGTSGYVLIAGDWRKGQQLRRPGAGLMLVGASISQRLPCHRPAKRDATRLPRLRLAVRQFSGSSLRVVS